MRLNFLVPTTGLTGGIKVIFTHANNLAAWGHEVNIIYPYVLYKDAKFPDFIKGNLKFLKRACLSVLGLRQIDWFNLNPKIKIIRVPDLSDKYIPQADATIATANETADWLVDYSVNKGEKYYFIQDYEAWTRPKDRVDATWKMPLKKIVIADWLKKLAQEKFGEEVVGVVGDGVDQAEFSKQSRVYNKEKKILMMYHVLEKKGFTDGLEAFNIAKHQHPEINLVLFGAYKLDKQFSEYPYSYRPKESQLKELYSNCDIFLWPSRIEGFGLPPLEAMASGCAVISTDTGAIREYAADGETAIIVPPRRIDLMAEAMIKLIENDSMIISLGRKAVERAGEWAWEKQSRQLENILLNKSN